MKNIYSWAVVVLIIIGYFTFVYKLNTKENIIRREPKSLFKFEEEQLQATITLIPAIDSNNIYTSTNTNLSSFSVNYPDNWYIDAQSNDNEAIITLKPSDAKHMGCIRIYQTKDNMPLLEAVNYNQYMMQKKDTPYFLKEAVETTISGQPAHISKVRLDNKKPEEFVQNVVIVQDNTYTTILRSCPGTKEEDFYSVLMSFKLL